MTADHHSPQAADETAVEGWRPAPAGAASMVLRAQSIISRAISKHGRAVLLFSGGMGSLAVLYLTRPWWDRIHVGWGNAGDEYPETRELMDQVKAMVPNFHEVRGNAIKTQADTGWPVDMLPQGSTTIGAHIDAGVAHQPMVLQIDCCATNLWLPLERAIAKSRISLVIRGQRDNRRLTCPKISDGQVVSGLTYANPIGDWDSDQVVSYLESIGVAIPRQHRYGAALDCMHCTAALHQGPGRARYLRDHHPEAAQEFQRRIRIIDEAQQRESLYLRALIESPSAK